MEKLLDVLNRLDGRLQKLESTQLDIFALESRSDEGINSAGRSVPEIRITSPAGDILVTGGDLINEYAVSSALPQDSALYEYGYKYFDRESEDLTEDGFQRQACNVEETMSWTKSLGDVWMLPPDDRIHLSFNQDMLERWHYLRRPLLVEALKRFDECLWGPEEKWEILDSFYSNIGIFKGVQGGAFLVTDFDSTGRVFQWHFGCKVKPRMMDLYDSLNRPQTFKLPFKNRLTGYKGGKGWPRAPWRRLIHIQGISNVLGELHWLDKIAMSSPDELDVLCDSSRLHPKELMPYLTNEAVTFCGRTRDNKDARHGISGELDNAIIRMHLDAKLVNMEAMAWLPKRGMTFHIVFYKTFKDPCPAEHWPKGSLYGNGPHLQQQACTIYTAFETTDSLSLFVDPSPVPEYWSTLYFTPRGFFVDAMEEEHTKPTRDLKPGNAQNSFLDLVDTTMHRVIASWGVIVKFFDEFLDFKVFMTPEIHDTFLIEDAEFSRSRKYFWAINCLADFDHHLNHSIRDWEKSKAIWERELPTFDPDGWDEAQRRLLDIEKLFDNLREVRDQFQRHHSRTTALRDGLFNASAVMESRASTKLGENVQLLTFVSIFFLPLAFCTSIWSVSGDTFPLHALLITGILIGSSTYFVVFNLNTLVHLVAVVHHSHKKILIQT